ncbi:hypothetical protein DENSPDRAFT_741025, partial [Dentipellis sp. KUC8613]
DIYLDEMQATLERRCHTEVSMASIWRALRRSGYTMKRVSFGSPVVSACPHFYDRHPRSETLLLYSWSTVSYNEMLVIFICINIYCRYSLLPAISLDGIMALDIIEGAFTSLTFAEFIDGLLDRMNPFPGPNSVIVMDNCAIHKSPIVLEMIIE